MNLELTADEAQRVINSQRREISELKGRLRRAWTQTHYMDGKSYPGAFLTPTMIDAAIKHLKDLRHLAECGNPDYSETECEELIALYENTKKERDYNQYRGIKVSMFDFRFLFVVTNYNERAAIQHSESMVNLRKHLLKDGEEAPPTHWFSGPGDKSWMP